MDESIKPKYSYECMINFFKLGNSPKDKAMAKKLEESLELQKYANGEVICHIGTKARAMYFIESGKVEVIGNKGQVLNELEQGQFFGEYAIISGDKTLSTVRSKGGTIVYRLKSKAVLEGVKYNPAAYSHLIKQLYGQISQKHSEILLLSSNRRGIVRDVKNQLKMSLKELLIHYSIVLLVFAAAFYFPPALNQAPVWVLLPVAFLIINMIVTKRTMESIVLASFLTAVIMRKHGFIFDFYNNILNTVSSSGTMEVIFILFLLGAVSQLLSCSGGFNALRRMIINRIKTKRSSLLLSLLCIVIIFFDDCLSLLIAGICFIPVNDKHRVSREMSSFVMRMPAEAICALVPISIWGVYLTGIITVTTGTNGAALFYKSIPFNFASVITLAVAFLAAAGKLPVIGKLKAAQNRVEKGGSLWPPHSDQYFTKQEIVKRGNVINLFLPIVILIAASIVSGTLVEGKFSINTGYGLVITLVFMFFLYCFQRLMTPEEFFDNIINGAESMLAPAILLVVTLCFSASISHFGLIDWLAGLLNVFIKGNYWMLPAVIFILFTGISALLGSSWSMYALGLPISISLAVAVDANVALCIGAVCAAGITGDGLSLYQSDSLFIASVVGCEPTAMISARFPYFVLITMLAGLVYLTVGFVAI